MEESISVLQQVVPDIMTVLINRYHILRSINMYAPVGRRILSEKVSLSERTLRTETDFLRKQGLLSSSQSGMQLTPKGEKVYLELELFMGILFKMNPKEKALADYLNIQFCRIVLGDSDLDATVLDEMGKEASKGLNMLLPAGDYIVAVAGGNTMARAAAHFSPELSGNRKFVFVPTRGGLGESMSIQANSVSDLMAQSVGGENMALFVPDNLSEQAYATMKSEPSIKHTLEVMKKANCLLYSIGNAKVMMDRRKMSPEEIAFLNEKNAVGEAFGCYFNENGEIVYRLSRFGLQIEEIDKIPYEMAIAGGQSKAKAIKAFMKLAPHQTWLITDMGAANLILKGITL
ncbi:Hypothetical protein Tpal_212 [Trichococcus palustris]|jgi:central glycolytic genes regulator|uniref:Uncharacterized protein n=1 Tax=Trichococcus palustris TaxID=140314 RepID=A0A143Y5S5_9LACT|nr:sugar-binding domain-containing protein [Trichococcus palustris]CZQ81536.1 Hypothetical protein Tpal_212 [Trichococcus palustris]SFK62337.1 central glycolytic genes regulator [Trichococcus palustris]